MFYDAVIMEDLAKDYAVRLRWRCGKNHNHLDHTLLGTPLPGVMAGIVPQTCPVCGSLVFVEAPPPAIVVTDGETSGKSFFGSLFQRKVDKDN